jgi:hypothetical protein
MKPQELHESWLALVNSIVDNNPLASEVVYRWCSRNHYTLRPMSPDALPPDNWQPNENLGPIQRRLSYKRGKP